jgi:hypothetical protein
MARLFAIEYAGGEYCKDEVLACPRGRDEKNYRKIRSETASWFSIGLGNSVKSGQQTLPGPHLQ